MRVTSSMLTAQVVANLGRNLSRFARIEEQLSSARRINRPSDDPIGTMRVLEYRHELEQIDQWRKDVQFGQSWLGGTDAALSSVDNLLVEAFDIVVNMSNDTIPDDQRDSLAGRVSAIIDQVLEAANATVSGRHLFSGTLTDRAAIVASNTGVVYNGNSGAVRTKLGAGTLIDLNSVGSNTFTRAYTTLGREFDLDVALSAATPVAQLNAGQGIQQIPGIFSIQDHNGTLTAFINVSTATTVGGVLAVINSTLAAFGMGNVTASIAPTGDGIRLTAAPNGIVRTTTLLSNLNAGTGVDGQPGAFVMHKSDGSADVQIDLSGAVTVGDAIAAFNSKMVSAGFGTVTMGLRADNRGLQITDTQVPPHGFEVRESTGSDTTAADLGLSGIVQASLSGAELNPQPDFEVKEFGPGLTTGADLGLLGRFHSFKDGAALSPPITTATTVAQLNHGIGLDLGRVRLALGDRSSIVDLTSATNIGEVLGLLNASGLPVEARINANATGIEIYSQVGDRSFIVTSDSMATAEKLGIVGSPDLFGSLYLLRQALEENNRDLVRSTNQSLQGALDQVVFERSHTGSKQIRLEATDYRLVDQILNATRLRSQYEDSDILALSSDLSRQEAVYQAALAAAARMIQPSLAQFLK